MQHWTEQSELQMYIWQCFLEGEWKDVWKFLCPEASLKFYWAISPCQQFFSQPQWGWAPIPSFSSLSALVTRPVSPLFRDFQFCWEEVWPQSGPLVTKTRHDQNDKFTGPGLWLVESDNVTWTLTSDWQRHDQNGNSISSAPEADLAPT